MGMSKSVKVILSLALVVFLALSATKVEARYIGYGGMHANHGIMCDRTRPATCKQPEVNPYIRGCEKAERCSRGGSAKKRQIN
ncbi:Protein RALF-like 9 [Cardamine amara subsp. amara]|uniref:Protein RALF-like 9 n=1 Tax=Cardamine amara subsp. amara TaxID=228776 RepID=A0ABD0ZZM5_CARAN